MSCIGSFSYFADPALRGTPVCVGFLRNWAWFNYLDYWVTKPNLVRLPRKELITDLAIPHLPISLRTSKFVHSIQPPTPFFERTERTERILQLAPSGESRRWFVTWV